MQYPIARRLLAAQLWTMIFGGMVATLGGLLSDVVASHVMPTFENRGWLAVGLFAFLWIAGTWLAVYKEYGTWFPLPAWIPSLDRATHAELEAILLPLMQKEQDRRALLSLAFEHDRVYEQIDFTGATEPFTVNMIEVLVRRGEVTPGKQALWALLETISPRVGVDQQERMAALRPTVEALSWRWQGWRPKHLPEIVKIAASRLGPLPLALFLILAVGVALGSPLVTKVYAQNVPYCLPDRICVLVVQFEPESDPAAIGFTNEIYDKLDQVLNATARERFTLHKVSLAEDEKNDQTPQQNVSRLARERGASLVVWGRIHENPGGEPIADVQFNLADLIGVGEASTTQPYRAEPLGYDALDQMCEDCMVAQTSEYAQIVAYTASGLYHYIRHRPRAARQALEAALYCAGELKEQALAEAKATCTPNKFDSDWDPGLLYYYRGKAAFLEGDFSKAVDDLEKAAQSNQDDPASLIGVAAAYQAWLGDGHERDPLVEQALAEAERRAKALLAKADTRMAPAVLYDLGFIYELAGKYDDAQQRYQAAAEGYSAEGLKTPDTSPYVSLIALARVEQKAGNFAAARMALRNAIAADPSLPWAYAAMAQSFEDEPTVARDWLRNAQSQASIYDASVDIVEAGLCGGKVWQDRACAAEAYQRALAKWPETGNLYSLVGDFYREDGEWSSAYKYYQVAVERLRPNDPWAHERLAYVLFQQGKYEDSAREYQGVIDLSHSLAYVPDGVYCAMALAQENAGELTIALETYRRCADSATDPARKKAAEDKIEQLRSMK